MRIALITFRLGLETPNTVTSAALLPPELFKALKEYNILALKGDCTFQAPLCVQWEDIAVGMKLEVLNTNAVLPSKVYWIASVIQLAGRP